VLDTSALLAIVNEERGAEVFTGRQEPLNIFVMSTVNVSEAYGKLIGRGVGSAEGVGGCDRPGPHIAAFDAEQARIAGQLLLRTRSLGLSLGDRACWRWRWFSKLPLYC